MYSLLPGECGEGEREKERGRGEGGGEERRPVQYPKPVISELKRLRLEDFEDFKVNLHSKTLYQVNNNLSAFFVGL